MFFVVAPFMMAQNAASASFWLKAISGLFNQMKLVFMAKPNPGFRVLNDPFYERLNGAHFTKFAVGALPNRKTAKSLVHSLWVHLEIFGLAYSGSVIVFRFLND